MLAKLWRPRLLLVVGVTVVIAYLLTGNNANAATAKIHPCPIGRFCIDQVVSTRMNNGVQSFVFTVLLRNNLNYSQSKLMLRLTTPKQVKVESANVPFVRHGARQIRWHVGTVVPGQTWTVKVRARSLSMDPATVTNTAFLFYDGSPWLPKKTSYQLFCQ